MIIVTGAAGFIGSCLVSKLNDEGFFDLILVDDFSNEAKNLNFEHKKYTQLVHRNDFLEWMAGKENQIQFVFHIGARTDTAEFNIDILNQLNLDYSKRLWTFCTNNGIPIIYASSAATYGMGEFGFDDNMQDLSLLKPLNPYGQSKLDFDIWALSQEEKPFYWSGFKFFNVYGPNEYHKSRMASVVFHAFNQIKSNNKLKLFRSHNPDYLDGAQQRDFIYVKDVVDVLFFSMINRFESDLYNLGTGKSQTFLDLASAVFEALNIEKNIEFIDTPADIRDKYQYFTEAKMEKLLNKGFIQTFQPIEIGVKDYVINYLEGHKYL